MPRLLSPGLFCPYRIHSARGLRILIARVSAGENESRPDGVVSSLEIVGQENVIAGTDCGLGGRVHPQIAWAKLRALRDGAAIASKKLWN
jgi:hypothetical protein